MFEFWIPNNPQAVHEAWAAYYVPDTCPQCGAKLIVKASTPIGPFNCLTGCVHTMQWEDLRRISLRKEASEELLHCMQCNSPNPQAEANRPYGKYLCFACRSLTRTEAALLSVGDQWHAGLDVFGQSFQTVQLHELSS